MKVQDLIAQNVGASPDAINSLIQLQGLITHVDQLLAELKSQVQNQTNEGIQYLINCYQQFAINFYAAFDRSLKADPNEPAEKYAYWRERAHAAERAGYAGTDAGAALVRNLLDA